jgi:hypothetical protein
MNKMRSNACFFFFSRSFLRIIESKLGNIKMITPLSKKILIFFFFNTLKKYVHNTYKQWSIFCKWLTTIVHIGDLSWFSIGLHDQLLKNNKTVNKRSFIKIYKYHIIVKCDRQPNKMLKWYPELIPMSYTLILISTYLLLFFRYRNSIK